MPGHIYEFKHATRFELPFGPIGVFFLFFFVKLDWGLPLPDHCLCQLYHEPC